MNTKTSVLIPLVDSLTRVRPQQIGSLALSERADRSVSEFMFIDFKIHRGVIQRAALRVIPDSLLEVADPKPMDGVTEYGAGLSVSLCRAPRGGIRPVICAFTESNEDATYVDLIELIAWIKKHHPQLLA
jgi:hypothetical protein